MGPTSILFLSFFFLSSLSLLSLLLFSTCDCHGRGGPRCCRGGGGDHGGRHSRRERGKRRPASRLPPSRSRTRAKTRCRTPPTTTPPATPSPAGFGLPSPLSQAGEGKRRRMMGLACGPNVFFF
uniref:Uncharacterized protein n=1 Tax=Oryza meridionalis TaxID=40149 RepID=A0A0E0DS54_9ORYZ